MARAMELCKEYRHEFVMPEHLLAALLEDLNFREALDIYYNPRFLSKRVDDYLAKIESVPDGADYEPEASAQLSKVIESALRDLRYSSANVIDITHLVNGLLKLNESWAAYVLKECLSGCEADFMHQLVALCEYDDDMQDSDEPKEDNTTWRKLVTCMNDLYQSHNPLIGRNQELRRTIQVLCRRDKNNPLHMGEHGVGKTALMWGLVQLISEGQAPKRLMGSRVYQLDMGTLMAGAQYRGDLENRIKMIMDGIEAEGNNNIVYIDGIHNLVGAGTTNDSSIDASSMLMPYIEAGKIRFVGSTTYEEYNRHFSRSQGLVRCFQQIDIAEPSVDETKKIVKQLQPLYESFHGVTYSPEAIMFAVDASARHINNRFLPDKAIDLIDEAGAAMEISEAQHVIGKKEIADVLSKVCKVEALSVAEEDDYRQLESLAPRMLSQIYGQDEAVTQVVEAIQMSRAGLLDDNKPLASLLFVGPTGVGKTEVARVLARELGIELVRFDMSEYSEKHTVAKLIGSPAGYVGYEDGGLLTDAIRKSPNCVLLLNEIEKAHQDIYNILLQVMDYARLTDNKGRHADFRNVVLIMTSNAGAQYASQSSIGFTKTVNRGEAMMKQVKKTFKPEFINRLSGAVVFHDMDKPMATLILKKKLRELDAKLGARHVRMALEPEAFALMLNEGFTPEYGAREMDRIISQKLKPLLMREILFGSLKNGGNIIIGVDNGSLSIRQ